MAKLRNLKIENEALAGINAADADETLSVKVDEDINSKESDVFTADIAGSSLSGGSTEPMVGNRTLSEHLRMRLLGYI